MLILSMEDRVFGLVYRHFLGVLASDISITGDVGFFESMVDRFTTYPSELLAFFGRTHSFLE